VPAPVWAAFSLFFCLILSDPAFCAAETLGPDAITGTWVVAEKDAHIEIYRDGDRYSGRICWLRDPEVDKPGEERLPKRERGETPKVGLIIVRAFRFDGKEWTGGTLYDPTDGKSYRGVIRLGSKGELRVRGFMGISLFGRTTVWHRLR
jgi:uncharacterized protein (DUF2147 family)